jgi:hypothetical protein
LALVDASAQLKATFHVGQDSADLKAVFETNLFNGVPADLYCKMRVYPHFSGKPANLFGKFFVGVDASEDLFAKFTVQATRDLFCKFTVRHSGYADLYNRFRVFIHFGEGWADLGAEFLLIRSDSEDLPAELIIRNADTTELKGILIVRQPDSADLFAETVIRHSDSVDLKGIFAVRHSAIAELKGLAVIRHTGTPLDLFAKFIAIPNEDLFAKFTVRQSTYRDLHGDFYVRHPYWLWTTRRYINGVVDAAESLVGDATLEYVIEGVMEDIQGLLDANDIPHDAWTNIALVPTLIRRATTYGTVAALYARHSRTFRSRVIPTAAPVTVTTIGDDERAMGHWEKKMQEALDNYLATQYSTRIWVSTADEEPIFSMADIPPSAEDEVEWHEWLQQRV